MEFTDLMGIAVILQLVTLRIHRLIGALVGGMYTTGVLFYGLYLFSSSDSISLMGKYELSMIYFFLFIFIWYTLDVLKAGWEIAKRFSTKEVIGTAKQ